MKKTVMMIMAIVAMTMVTNAATLTWGVSGTKTPNSDGTFSAVALSGGIAYVFVGAQNTANLITAIEGKTFTGAGNLYSKATSGTGFISQAGLGSYSMQDVTLYTVIFDKGTIAGSGFYMISSDVTQHFENSNLTYSFTTANGRLPDHWTAVPEPTSFALVGLGAAALALRRRIRKA
jgi:hypothetical protein